MTLKTVITLHGIRTRGVWQKELVPMLVRAGFVPYSFDYEYFSAWSLMLPSRREEKTRWFLDQYDLLRAQTGDERPSVIAHSFGSYIVAAALELNPEIVFDKVIFCGSIVREDFDWPTIIARRQVNVVENDYGKLDIWPKLASQVIAGAGTAGSRGFKANDLMLVQREFPKYRHSDYFSKTHFQRYWIRALLLDTRRLRTLLSYVVGMCAADLALPREAVRSSIFVPARNGQFLRIPADLHVGLAREEAERTIPIDIDNVQSPGIGEAFKTLAPTIVQVAQDFRWDLVPTSSRLRLRDGLQWLISIPISDASGQRCLGVLTIDGLRPVSNDALALPARKMLPFAQQMADLIASVEEWI